MQIFRGVWPALMTPSDDVYRVHEPALRALVDYLVDKRVDGFYVGGTTGEGIFMPVIERKRLVEIVMQQVNGRALVIVHAGAVSAQDAVDLARHARDCGAAGVSSVLPPLYESMDALYGYYQALAAAIPDLPFMAYMLNPKIDSVALMRRLMDIPNLSGTKYTGPNMYEFRQMIDLGRGAWTMFSGMDEQAVYANMMGATGNVGSTLNFMPGAFRQMAQAVAAGQHDAAQSLQVQVNQVIAIMIAAGFPAALKAVVSALIGIDCGEPRLPGLPLSAAQKQHVLAQLAETDFDALTRL